jgi:cytochrome P450
MQEVRRDRYGGIMSTDTPQVVGLDPFAPGFYENPYEQYAGLREHDPIHRSSFGPWMLTRWADVHALLRTPGTSVEEHNIDHGGPTRREQLADLVEGREVRTSRGILDLDPPDHTRLRGLVSKAFTPRAVERVRGRAGELVDGILERLAGHDGPVDLISELAFPLPFTVISEMLGMPDGDRNQLRTWSHTITQILDPWPTPSPGNGPDPTTTTSSPHSSRPRTTAMC